MLLCCDMPVVMFRYAFELRVDREGGWFEHSVS